MRLVHNFLWYLIYGHPLRHHSPDSQTPADLNSCDPAPKQPDHQEKQDPKESTNGQSSETAADCTLTNLDVTSSGDEEEELKDKSTPGQSQPDMKGKTESCTYF